MPSSKATLEIGSKVMRPRQLTAFEILQSTILHIADRDYQTPDTVFSGDYEYTHFRREIEDCNSVRSIFNIINEWDDDGSVFARMIRDCFQDQMI